MAYEPEDTFRLRLRDRIDICHPRRIGTTTELSEVVGEMHRGHIYLIIGLPDLRDVKAFGLAFTELLQPAREDVYRVDHNGVISMYYRIEDEDIKVSAPFLVFQPDLESSPTGGDNAVESAIRACDETWDKQHRKWVYSANCCPIFVVMFSSSSLSVYGSAFTHKWVFQGLTQACITFTNIIDPSAFGTLARLLWALRQSVSHLQEWYRKTVLASVFPQFYDRLHPATTSVQDQTGAIVGFCYFRRIEPHDKVFLAFAAKRDHAFAVKFTPRYCAEAHRFLAEANCAPDLVYCGSPYTEFPGYTRMQMVVTEFCPEGLILWEIARKPLRDKLRDAIALLHSQGMVHGDLRWQNILVDRDGHIRLIDFDWAGIEGVARCPDDLAEDVPWPAEPGALITKEHDRYMLERVFKPEAALR
ncbi:hypothetical protein L226DRAFT_612305 [Lentinus tigrinus ALCF2SS1-7]|uniref:uncharacterized protein n=1 Tax=Lentinus tigrinus ALCF2SS1-7 TaxID=1328758 RepID=UPI0011663887|nr:hypothetical protein L226DRAFT_612305 [Lentinus tigrinus ALCF2SS1-7]